MPEPEQKQQVRVLIALLEFIADTGQTGESGVHHQRLKRHTLHPVASALREHQRAVALEEAREAAAPPAEEGE